MTSPGSKTTRTRIDLSPEAVTRRLRRVEELRRLCLALARARPAQDGPEPQGSGEKPRR